MYFDAARIELFLNGKKVGAAKVKNCKASFKVKYSPGKLEAAAYDAGGREIGRTCLMSAKKADITLLPEKTEVKPGEVVFISVVMADKDGNVESNVDRKIKISVEGGELLAFGSANPRTEEMFDSGEYSTYYGRALAAVRAGESGTVRVAASDWIETAETGIKITEKN